MKKIIIVLLFLLPLLTVAKGRRHEKIVITKATIEMIASESEIIGRLWIDIPRCVAKARQIIELRPFLYSNNETIRLTPLLIYGRSARLHEMQKWKLSKYQPYYKDYPKAKNKSVCEYLSTAQYNGTGTDYTFVIEKWKIVCGNAKFLGYIVVDDVIY